MLTHVQSHGFTLTDAIHEYTNRRIHFAVSFASEYVQRISVMLSDINGPRGGEDKRCHIVVKLLHMPSVIIEDTQSNLYVAIDRAVERAGRVVARHLERKNTLRGVRVEQFLNSDKEE